jgi:peptidyl-prolyl cis-trans isomerase C
MDQMMEWEIPARCLVVGTLLVVGGACSREEQVDALARVGEVVITSKDFNLELESRQGRSPVPVNPQALLEEMVEREVLVQNAVKEGLNDDPEVRELVRDVLIAKYRERRLDKQLEKASEVSSDELSEAYKKEKASLLKPERARLAVLFLGATSEEEVAAQKGRLQAALEQIRLAPKEEAGFGKLAVEFSEDQESRYRGGDIGWVERERFPPRLGRDIIEAGFELTQLGQVSDVIQVKGGVCVLRLLERQAASVIPIEQAEPALRQRLVQARQEQIRQDFQSALRQRLRVEVHAEKLKGLLAATRSENLPPSIP